MQLEAFQLQIRLYTMFHNARLIFLIAMVFQSP